MTSSADEKQPAPPYFTGTDALQSSPVEAIEKLGGSEDGDAPPNRSREMTEIAGDERSLGGRRAFGEAGVIRVRRIVDDLDANDVQRIESNGARMRSRSSAVK